ncbi:MAG: protein O-GlcNAcase [candidate division WOR-3 bacterium]|nr:protein O-GlcNAcase [candidate division WOR-3 bacterium]
MAKNNKIFGVVEGFYGRYYSFQERCDLIKFLAELGLNTYVYGPKSDPYHRKEYYRFYPSNQLKEFETLNTLAKRYKINFNYALSPGPRPSLDAILKKITSMLKTGIEHFSIFFDDIKIKLDAKSALMQIRCANEVYTMLKDKGKDTALYFCPTQYRGFERNEYIETVARNLNKNTQIFWTGKSVVSKKITVKDIENITQILQRPPLIWDNIFANDYIPGIILKFPYRNREPGIIDKVSGILLNPMNQYLQSKPLIYTAAQFFKDPYHYHPKDVWQRVKKIFY